FGHDVLAETTSSSMFFRPLATIHRFVLAAGQWNEAAPVSLAFRAFTLTPIGGRLYGITERSYGKLALSEIGLTGAARTIWEYDSNRPLLEPTTIARSAGGDFAIGATGYAIRIHPQASTRASWLAPADCVGYEASSQDSEAADARCRAAPGAAAFTRRRLVPAYNMLTSHDGAWMIVNGAAGLAYFLGGSQTSVIALPPERDAYFRAIEDYDGSLEVLSSRSLWVRRNSIWINFPLPRDNCYGSFFFGE